MAVHVRSAARAYMRRRADENACQRRRWRRLVSCAAPRPCPVFVGNINRHSPCERFTTVSHALPRRRRDPTAWRPARKPAYGRVPGRGGTPRRHIFFPSSRGQVGDMSERGSSAQAYTQR